MAMIGPGAFRLLLATIVVVHHSFPLRLGNWAVGMFFALSGYWISHMWRSKYSRLGAPYWTFLISRWWRLAPLFLSVQLIAAALICLNFRVGNISAIRSWLWWISQPFVGGATQFGSILPPSWSLDVEMQFYTIAPMLVVGIGTLCRNERVLLTLLLLFWSLGLLTAGAPVTSPRLDLYAWIFVVGAVFERRGLAVTTQNALLSAAGLNVLWLAAFVFPDTRALIWQSGTVEAGISESARNLFYVSSILIGFPLAMSTVRKSSGPWDRWFGDLSYPVYLFHWLPREAYYELVDWSRPAWQNASLLTANFLLTFIGSALLLHVIDRPLQRLRGRWLTQHPTT